MKPTLPPLFVDAPVQPDSIPKALLNESFRCLEKSGQCYCFQVVEKVHSRGGVVCLFSRPLSHTHTPG